MSGIYLTQNDLENRLSADGVSLRTADGPPTSLGDVIAQAGADVDEHCLLRYNAQQLSQSDWIHQRAIDLAAMYLCERLGNPPPASVERKYNRAMTRLEQVRVGSINIPDAHEIKASVPVMTNMRVVMRPYPRPVVEPTLSTGEPTTDYRQNRDPLDFLNQNLDYVI